MKGIKHDAGVGGSSFDEELAKLFTDIDLALTERLHGAIIPVEGEIVYLSPAFEEPKTREYMLFGDDVRCTRRHTS